MGSGRQVKVNHYLAATNQKFFFCRLLMAQASSMSEGHGQQALLQSALFQMGLAYRFYLWELASRYQCPTPETIENADALNLQIEAMDKYPVEGVELVNLAKSEGSWLNCLQNSYRHLFLAEQTAPQPIQEDDRLPVVNIDIVRKQAVLSDIQRWLSEFELLIERQREVGAEY
jgi:hypothetical protein